MPMSEHPDECGEDALLQPLDEWPPPRVVGQVLRLGAERSLQNGSDETGAWLGVVARGMMRECA